MTIFSQSVLLSKGVELNVSADPESDEYFGGSSLLPGKFEITLGRRLLEDPTLAPFILCHELGHLIAPHQGKYWAASELQSDGYAVSQCLPLLIPNLSVEVSPSADFAVLDEECRLHHPSTEKVLRCQKIGRLSFFVFEKIWLFMDVKGFPKPQFRRQSGESILSSHSGYPSLQDRLDAIFRALN